MPKQNVDEKQISYMYKQFKLNSKKHIVHNTIMLLAVRVILIFITWWNLRVGKMKRILIGYPSGQDGPILSAWDFLHAFLPYNKFFIDQACLAKMAEYWPRSFLCFY